MWRLPSASLQVTGTPVLQHHTLEADAVYDGRPSPCPHWRRGHGFSCVAEKPSVEKAHVGGSELGCHFQARPHISKSKMCSFKILSCGCRSSGRQAWVVVVMADAGPRWGPRVLCTSDLILAQKVHAVTGFVSHLTAQEVEGSGREVISSGDTVSEGKQRPTSA